MMYLGAVLFVLIFLLLAPQTQAFLLGAVSGLVAFMTDWAPYSYLLILIMVGCLFAGLYVIQSWPAHVEPENPMAKYRREAPLEED